MKNYLFFLLSFSQTMLFAGFSPCDTAILINCGETLQRNTLGGTNHFNNDQYVDCVTDLEPWDANDLVFKISSDKRQVIHIYLNLLSHKDMDMFLFEECDDIGHCLATTYEPLSTGNIYLKSIEIIVEAGTYYVIVDGSNSLQNGMFELSVNCECSCVEDLNPLFARSIRCENFDKYLNSSIDFQSNQWTKWRTTGDGTIELIGTEKVMRVKSASNSGDLYYSLTDLGIKRHRISWKMFFEEGATGAYGLLNKLPNGSNPSDTVYNVLFKTQEKGKVVMNGDTVASFTYNGGNWNDIMQIVDPQLDTIEIWINNQFVFGSKYSVGANLPYNIQGVRFFTITNSNYLVDHICAWEMTGVGPGNCGLDSVCTSSGGTFVDSCSAEQQLYSSQEYQECIDVEIPLVLTVCDYGGSAIYRTDIFTGVFTPDDEIPSSVLTNECVLAAFNGAIYPNYTAQIKVYYNDVGENIGPQFSTNDSSILFVFRCDYNPDSNKVIEEFLGQVDAIDPACTFNTGESMDVGLYYFVFFGEIGDDYTLSVVPEGACKGVFNQIICGDSITETLPGDYNFAIDTFGDYATCYKGTGAYKGKDMVYYFDIISPTIVNIHLSAPDKKAIFLYNFLCAKNCLDYAETSLSGGLGEIINVSLLTGRYYIIVDSDSLSNDEFTLSMDCVPDLQSIPRIFNNGDTICPIEDGDENVHKLNIPITASTYLKNGAYLTVGYSDLQSKGNVITDFWFAPDYMELKLPQDSTGDGEKCGFSLNDTIMVTIYSPWNGSDYALIPCKATYDDLIPGSITAKGNFLPEGRSVINSLIRTKWISITVDPTFKNFSAQAQAAKFTVRSGAHYTITKDPGAGWLTLIYQEGNQIVDVILTANPGQKKRETDLLITIAAVPPIYRTIHISQRGPCIDPIVAVVSQSGENSFCEGENVVLNAVVDNGAAEYYDFNWNNDETTQQISFTALKDTSFMVTVTESECYESSTASINISVVDAPEVNAGPDVTICPGEIITLNAVTNPPTDYHWNTGQTTSAIEVNPEVETTYTVTISGEECDRSDSVTVFIYPVAAWTIHSDSLIHCKGDATGQLSVVSNNGSQPQSILWSNNNTSPVISNLIAGQYFVSVTDTFGCTHLDTFDLTEPDHVINFSIHEDSQIKCFGDSTGQLSLESSDGSQPMSVLWSNNVTSTINSNLMAGLYTVTITDQFGCNKIEMFDLTEPDEEIQFADTIIMHPTNGQNGSIQITITGGVPPYSYKWRNSMNVVISTDSILSGQMAGCYSLIVRDTVGCEAVTGCIELTTSILKVGQVEFNVFPNPTKDLIFIQCERPPADKIVWYFRDLMGKVIRSGTWDKVSESGQIINVSGIPQGCYLLNLQAGTHSGMEKVIVY